MVPVVVFVLGNALATEPNVTDASVEWPPEVLRVFTEHFVTEVTEHLWGQHSFSTREAVALNLRETWVRLLIAERVDESRLTNPFTIGHGWTCGVGASSRPLPSW